VEKDTWEPRENLENTQELVDRFEEEYREEGQKNKKEELERKSQRRITREIYNKTTVWME